MYDEDGSMREGDILTIQPGEVYEMSDSPHRIIGANDTFHLECENGNWLEIQQQHLDEFFSIFTDEEKQ